MERFYLEHISFTNDSKVLMRLPHPTLLDFSEINDLFSVLNEYLDFLKSQGLKTDECVRKFNENIKKEYYKNQDNQCFKTVKTTNIYLMFDELSGLYKIGHSKNPIKREGTLLSQAPKIKLLHSFKEQKNFEITLHKKFKDKRIRGEWFELTEEDVEYIKSLGQ